MNLEGEILSNKSSSNKIQFNTIMNSDGELTLRHGRNVYVVGNYIKLNNKLEIKNHHQGIQIHGPGHKVYCNQLITLKSEQ